MQKSTSKKNISMRGFMCQSSLEDITGCVPRDYHMRSVIEPIRRRSASSSHEGKYKLLIDDHQNQNQNHQNHSSATNSSTATVYSDHWQHFQQPSYSNTCTVAGQTSTLLPCSSVVEQIHYPNHGHRSENTKTLHNSTSSITFQVVVLRVSLHCHGCAGKLKKHLSKMEGVSSFSIDLDTKRVTVMGHVSPAEVLESISKIKRAEFWSY